MQRRRSTSSRAFEQYRGQPDALTEHIYLASLRSSWSWTGGTTERAWTSRLRRPAGQWEASEARRPGRVGVGGGVTDEPATAQALAGAVLRGVDCGAVAPEEAADLTGVDRARLEELARRVRA